MSSLSTFPKELLDLVTSFGKAPVYVMVLNALIISGYEAQYTDSFTEIIGVKTNKNSAWKTALQMEYKKNLVLIFTSKILKK